MTDRIRRPARVLVVMACLMLVVPAGQKSVGHASTTATALSSTPSASPPLGFSMTVSPTRLALPASEVGKDQKFVVTHNGGIAFDVVVSAAGFTPNSDGTLRYEREDVPYSAAKWVGVSPGRFRLEPGAHQVVTTRITIPANPDFGDHHVALLFMVPAASDSSNIRLNRGIGTPIYITVPGPVDDTVKMTGLSAPSFALGHGPVEFTATVQNTGTVHRDFRGAGRLEVRVAGKVVTFPDFTVQRGMTRTITARWDDAPRLCVCEAEVAVAGGAGQTSRADATVVIFPAVDAGIAAGAVGGVVVLGLFVRRRYRARVLATAHALRAKERLSEPRGASDDAASSSSGRDDLVGDLPESD